MIMGRGNSKLTIFKGIYAPHYNRTLHGGSMCNIEIAEMCNFVNKSRFAGKLCTHHQNQIQLSFFGDNAVQKAVHMHLWLHARAR